VELVRPRFGRDQYGRACAGAVLGRVVVGQDFEFLDGINRRQNRDTAGGQLIIVIVIVEPVGTLHARSANREREGSASRYFAAGAATKEALRIRLLGCAGGERGQLDKIAAVQGKFRDLLGSDDLSQRGIGGLDGYFRRADFDGRRNRCESQGEIHLALLVQLQPNVLLFAALKALSIHPDGEKRDGQQGDEIMTGIVGGRLAGYARVLGGDLHLRSRNHRPGLVRDRA